MIFEIGADMRHSIGVRMMGYIYIAIIIGMSSWAVVKSNDLFWLPVGLIMGWLFVGTGLWVVMRFQGTLWRYMAASIAMLFNKRLAQWVLND